MWTMAEKQIETFWRSLMGEKGKIVLEVLTFEKDFNQMSLETSSVVWRAIDNKIKKQPILLSTLLAFEIHINGAWCDWK